MTSTDSTGMITSALLYPGSWWLPPEACEGDDGSDEMAEVVDDEVG